MVLSFQIVENDMKSFAEVYGLKNIIFIDQLYQDNVKDNDNYERIYSFIMSKSKEFKQISLLLQGHPLVGVTLSQRFKKQENLIVNAFAAPSSFDNLIIDKWNDPLERGSLMIDANRLLLFNQQVNPYYDTYLYHICSVGNSKTNFTQSWQGNRIDLLVEYLKKFWPQDHNVSLIYSRLNNKSETIETTIEKLALEIENIHFGMTLFIPALKAKNINEDFLKILIPNGFKNERK